MEVRTYDSVTNVENALANPILQESFKPIIQGNSNTTQDEMITRYQLPSRSTQGVSTKTYDQE